MTIKPKILWDIGYIEGLSLEIGDGHKLLCLSPISFRMVTEMSQMLMWPTRYGLTRDDDVPEFGRIAYKEVNNPMCLNDVNNSIQAGFAALVAAMDAMEHDCPDINLTTCNSLTAQGFPEETPEGWVDFRQPLEPLPQPENMDYKCAVANKWIDVVIDLVENFFEYTKQASPYSWLYDLMTDTELGTAVYSVLVSMLNFVIANSYGLIVDDIVGAINSRRDELICAVYSASDPIEATQSVEGVVSGMDASFVVKHLTRMFLLDANDISLAWVDDAVDVTGYEMSNCLECALPDGWMLLDPSNLVEYVPDAETTVVNISQNEIYYEGYLPGSDVNWTPSCLASFYPHEELPEGWVPFGMSLVVLQNEAAGSNDPVGKVKVNGRAEAPIDRFLLYDRDYGSNPHPDLVGVYDQQTQFSSFQNQAFMVPTGGTAGVVFYARSGVLNPGGSIGPVRVKVQLLLRQELG